MSGPPPAHGGFPPDGLQALMSGNRNSPLDRVSFSTTTTTTTRTTRTTTTTATFQSSLLHTTPHTPHHLPVPALSLGFPGVGAGSDSPGSSGHLPAQGFGFASASASGPALLVPAGSAPSAPTPVGSDRAIHLTSTPTPTPRPFPTFASLARQQNQAFAALHSAFASPHYFNTPTFAAHLPNVHLNNNLSPTLPNANGFFDQFATANSSPPSFLQPPFFSPLHHRSCELHLLPQIFRPVGPSPVASSTSVPQHFGYYIQAPNLEAEGFDLRQDLEDFPRDEDNSPADNVVELEDQDEDLQDDQEQIAAGSLLDDDNMPAATTSRKRTRNTASLDDPAGPATVKRPRSQSGGAGVSSARKTSKPRKSVTTVVIADSDDIFAPEDDDGKQELFDMTENDNLPEENKVVKEDTSTKLCKFECIICLDAASNLTVTHCGHMFCGPCLHQAMHAEVTKKICPMCRQKLDTRQRNAQPSKMAKTFFPLEMKLKLSKSQGKQPVRSMRRA